MRVFGAKTFLLSVRLLLGVIFLVSAAAKLISLTAFDDSLRSFGLLTPTMVPLFVYLIPALELLLSLLLLSGIHVEKSAMASTIMLVIFLAAAASASISGAVVENCGCFGEIYRSGLGVGFFVRNGILLLMAVLLYGISETKSRSGFREADELL
jgi:uncharacterized membrane protein YphA (DoxX/SURF4 family)